MEKRARRAFHMVQLVRCPPVDRLWTGQVWPQVIRRRRIHWKTPPDVHQYPGTLCRTVSHSVNLKNGSHCLRSCSCRMCAGITADHLRPLLEHSPVSFALGHAALLLAQNRVPEEVINALRCGRLTALRKPDGGVRGMGMSSGEQWLGRWRNSTPKTNET